MQKAVALHRFFAFVGLAVRVRFWDVKSSQVKSSQVKSSQVKSSQVKSSQGTLARALCELNPKMKGRL